MTTETQTKEQGSLTSRLAGVVAGMNLAAGTLACMDHPILFPYVAMGAVIGSALAHDGVTITKAAGGITIGLAVTVVTGLNNFGATFARLTNQMVSGDDITIADDFKKQIQDRTVYIKDVLVGTPITVGCERELTQLNQGTYGQYLHRQTYPPIFGRPSGATNYSPSFNDGFLDKFNYLSAWNGNPDTVNCSGAIDRITVPADSAGGLKLDFTYNSKNSCDVVSRRFEKMIGIY